MLLTGVLALVLLCSVVPAALFCSNLRLYRAPPPPSGSPQHVAVLVPARNEEPNLRDCVESVLSSRDVRVAVWILNDNSTDGTAGIAAGLAAADTRVRVLKGASLPEGWNGKQFACAQLASAAGQSGASLLLFLDADVRLAPDAIARMAAFQQTSGAALVSGFPRQITETTLEWLLLPLIHFVLLAFLPLGRMRRSTSPAYAAGCGQFMLVERSAYVAAGGHAAIRQTRHDGLLLPRIIRAHGFKTDLADLTALAAVRMYSSGGEVWRGLAKNATEGMAAPSRIVPFTVLLLLGQVAPLLLAAWFSIATARGIHAEGFSMATWDRWSAVAKCLAMAALLACLLPRMLAAQRFKQSWKSVWLHPLGVVFLLLLQWFALLSRLSGRPVDWKQRLYRSSSGAQVK